MTDYQQKSLVGLVEELTSFHNDKRDLTDKELGKLKNDLNFVASKMEEQLEKTALQEGATTTVARGKLVQLVGKLKSVGRDGSFATKSVDEKLEVLRQLIVLIGGVAAIASVRSNKSLMSKLITVITATI